MSSTATSALTAPLKLVARLSKERGHAQPTRWLNTFHTFSFANYYDPRYSGFHSFHVLNEDRVLAANGFGTHPHHEYEIFSYVVSGALRHKDSMGNNEVIPRGGVQFTSAGTGIAHSEFNASLKDPVHFLQMWVKPNVQRLAPSYQTKQFDDADKRGKLCLIVSPASHPDEKSVKIHQDVKVYASILQQGETVSYQTEPGRELYIHVIQHVQGFTGELDDVALQVSTRRSLATEEETPSSSSSLTLKGGDGAFVLQPDDAHNTPDAGLIFKATGDYPAEFLLFDVKKSNEENDAYGHDDDDY